MNSSSRLAASVFGCMFLSLTIAQDKQALDEQRLTWAPFAIQDEMGMVIEPPVTDRLVVMNVRIINADGEVVQSWRSHGEPVFVDTLDLPDGEYRYEIVSVIDVAGPQAADSPDDTETAWRNFGRFSVIEGRSDFSGLDDLAPMDSPEVSDASGSRWWIRGLGFVLDRLVSDAVAQDIAIVDPSPTLKFQDTTPDDTDGSDWFLRGWEDFFFLEDADQNHAVMWFAADSAATEDSIEVYTSGKLCLANCRVRIARTENTHGSIYVWDSGEISFGNFNMQFDKSALSLGIGTVGGVAGDIIISDHDPDIRMHDESGTQEAEIELNNDGLRFWARPDDAATWNLVTGFDVHAPNYSMYINAAGNAGFGTSNAASSIEVWRDDGTAQILVNENNASRSTRELMRIKNNGPVEMVFDDAAYTNDWVARAQGVNFRIYRQNAYADRLELNKNGNMMIGGTLTENSDRNAKQGIEPVNPDQILEKVAALPVAHWQYTDDPDVDHIGPMAQDFHAAFGVGASETGISTLDSSGVALAAIQALAGQNKALSGENAQLRSQNISLEQRVFSQENRLFDLEALVMKMAIASENAVAAN